MLLLKTLAQAATVCLLLQPVGAFAFGSTETVSSADFAALHRYIIKISSADATNSETCLACHGPFTALQQKTADYVAPNGVPVNPHITFDMAMPNDPHSSGKNPIECTECHQPHSIPITEPVPPANTDMCVACHHTGTFRSCSDCH